MTIDKRISYAFGGTGGRAPGVGGGGNGGNGRSRALQQIAAKAPSPASAPKGERKNPFEETGQTKIEQEKIAKNVQELRDKVKELKKEYPLQKDEFDDPEFYVDLDKYMEDKDLYSSGDVKEKTGPKIDIGFQEALRKQKIARDLKTKQQDPRYGQFFAPKPVVEKPKKGLLGTLGTMALGIVAPALLPAKLAKAYSTYNQMKNISKLASTFTGKDIVSDLTKNLRSNISTSNLTGKRSTTDTTTDTRDDRFGEGDGIQVTPEAPKDVVTAGIQRFTPRQTDLVRQRYDQLRQVMQSGEYMGQKLNNNQLASLQNVSKQMEAFLVDPKKMMMMARGGLAGLNG